jgi:hypothetical protein
MYISVNRIDKKIKSNEYNLLFNIVLRKKTSKNTKQTQQIQIFTQ